jgi:hypothetical protein
VPVTAELTSHLVDAPGTAADLDGRPPGGSGREHLTGEATMPCSSSVHDPPAQSASAHTQRRLCQTTRTGRPNIGRSTSSARERSHVGDRGRPRRISDSQQTTPSSRGGYGPRRWCRHRHRGTSPSEVRSSTRRRA